MPGPLISLVARVVAAVVLLALPAACGKGTEVPDGTREPTAGPDWIDAVYPVPGSKMSSASVVEVEYDVQGGTRAARLLVDGVDITNQAKAGPGKFHYDPRAGSSRVRLRSGTHRATVRLVEVAEFGSRHEVIDSFTWRFTVL